MRNNYIRKRLQTIICDSEGDEYFEIGIYKTDLSHFFFLIENCNEF